VVASRPGAGGELARGEPVVIELAAPRIEVPRLVGLRWPEARRVLERAGLRPGVVRERYDDRRKALVVLEQEPAAGRRVEKASRVDVVRNEGD
jgi:beta-lactam-binding protein with PASTA domain